MRTNLCRVAAVLAVFLTSIPSHAEPSSPLIHLHAGVIDTSQPETQARRQALDTFSGKRLHLIQLAGPIQPAWHQELIDAGLQIIDYIPDNTYLVYGDAAALNGMQKKTLAKSHINWDGAYRSVDKIHPTARVTATAKRSAANSANDTYAIQLVLDPEANASTLALIDAVKLAPIIRQSSASHYHNVIVRLPADTISSLAGQPDVISIWPYRTPQKRDERQGVIVAGNLTGNVPSGAGYLDWLASKGFNQAQFDASGLVVDVTDSGLDNGTTNINHFALYRGGTTSGISRVRYTRLEGTANAGSTIQGCDGHGNLNAHIIGGHVTLTNFPHTDSSGYRYGLGIAPFTKVGSSVIFDPAEFTFPVYEDLASRAYRDGARVSGNSWGANTAGGYDVDAQTYDLLVRDAQPAGSAVPNSGNQQMTFVFAAGNAGAGTQTVGSPGTAKNVITVGAAENVHAFGGADASGVSDTGANSANDIISFSSRGPCSDSRKKPDIVAPGTHVSGGVGQAVRTMAGTGTSIACFSGEGVSGGANSSIFHPPSQRFYTASSGTSHSTPAVAGGAALVYQWFINNFTNAPSPAMIKSFLMNAARYMNGTGANDTLYSNNQGMGMMNLGTSFDGTPRLLRDQLTNDLFTASGQSRTFTGVIVSNSKPFRVTLAWTDAPGATSGNSYKNNLNLSVVVNGQTYLGNVFSGANSITGGSADPRNNVESVFLPAGTTGSVAITVSAANINSDGVPNFGGSLDQDFALVVYNYSSLQAPVIGSAGSQLVAESCGAGNGEIDPLEIVTISIALQNLGSANTTNVVATLLSTGGVTAPSGAQSYGALLASGAPITNTFSFTAAGVCGGTVTATVSLVDGATSLGTISHVYRLGGTVETTVTNSNTSAITIVDNAAASPYPSSINISGLAGTVAKVVVTLQGFSHAYPEDVDVILVGPGGQRVGLMGAVGADVSVTGLTLTFDDNAASQLGSPLTSGTWQPSGSVASMPGAAPAGPYGTTLSDFIGSVPNGTWSLYVADAAATDTGSISTGWKLAITAGQPFCCATNIAPTISPIADQTVVVNDSLSFFVLANDLVDNDPITLTASNLPPSALFGSTNGVGSFLWTSASPAGVYTSRFYATDKDGTTIEEVVITCRTNEAPVLEAIGNKFISVSNTLTFAVSATDPVGNDAITLSVSNLPAGATFGSTNGSGTFTWLNASPTGTYFVSFYATDIAGTAMETIQITVSELPPFVTYTETFDITPNWGGGAAGSYNAKTYANNSSGPSGDTFSANSAVRETSFSVTSNAWRLGTDSTADLYLRYALTNIVTRFAVQIARWDNNATPRFEIRYSLDSGGAYTTLFSTNGDWFVSDKAYKTFDSGPLNLVPVAGQQIWIEVFRSTGERLLIDNFEVDYIPSGGAAPQTPPTLNNIGAKSVTLNNTLAFAVTAVPTDSDTVTLIASNLPAGAVFGSTNEIGTFTWTSAAPLGVYTSSFHATDNDGTDSESVVITVSAASTGCIPFAAFTNSSTITLVDNAPASPYPSSITIGGVTQPIGKVTVTLTGMTHGFIADLDALLVGPGGQKILLLAGAAIGAGANNVTLTFDADAAAPLPQSNTTVSSGTYQPSIYLTSELDPPAPTEPYEDTLDDLIGTSPNGTWSLYMRDWEVEDDGVVAQGWSIQFELACGEDPPPGTNGSCGVIISEYVEGSSNNKALEIYNGTASSIDLAAGSYVLQWYNNGSAVSSASLGMTGIVAAGATFVVVNNSASTNLKAKANLLTTSTVLTFNGDDAIVLRQGGSSGTIIDSIGQTGFDPGSEWGTGLASTGDNTLRRKSTVLNGNTNTLDVFVPDAEWDGYVQDTFDGLGAHVMDCAPPNPDTDVDNIPDQWEIDNFGSLTNVNGSSDWDNDGFIDLHEYLAGTEPTNNTSFLYVDDSAVSVGGGIVIQWPGVTGKSYDLSRTTNLLAAIYQLIATNIPGVNPLNIYTDSTPTVEQSIYRIELSPAP